MAVPRVINTSDPNISYIETDLAVYNLKPRYRALWGQYPIAWRKQENNVISQASYYIIRPQNSSATAGTKDFGKWPVITSIGIGTGVSAMCGTDETTSVGHAVPDLRTRGVISTSEGASTVSIGTSGSDIYNISKDELLRRWRAYLYAERNDLTRVSDLTIWYHKRGQAEYALRTFDDLVKAFPRYFQFDDEFNRQALASLTGGETGNKIYADGQWWPTTYVGLWDKFANLGMSDSVIRRELIESGYTEAQINAARSIKGLTIYDLQKLSPTSKDGNTGGSGGGTSGGGGVGPDRNPWTGPEGYKQGAVQTITIQRSRNLFLTAEEASPFLATKVALQPGRPVMYQVYLANTINDPNDPSQSPLVNPYIFDVAPNEISYSGFGGEWVTIERTGGFPFIDWKNFRLLQVSFNFVIANKNGPVTADGLETPVTDQINQLRRMAQTPFPVMFYGFDTLLTNQFRYDEEGNPRGIQFIIQDLNITATRRNSNMEITRAQANITLQEIPVERQALIGMPRLRHKPVVPKEETKTPEGEDWGKFTDQTPPRDKSLTINVAT